MRILIISFFTDWTTHLGTELEIAQNHMDAGDEVSFLSCDGGIKACRANPNGNRQTCDICRYRRLRGFQTLSKPVLEHHIGDYIDKDLLANAEAESLRVRSAEDARNFFYAGHDLGWGALSSTIQELRDPVCASEAARGMLTRLTRTAILSYEAVRLFLDKNGPFDKAYIFNGRFASTRGAFRACRMIPGLHVILHERGSTPEKYALFENELLHTRQVWRQSIDDSWESEPDEELKTRIGSQFFEESRGGASIGWKSFVDHQSSGLLPDGWEPSKTNIAIFNSSEDEYAAIGDEWENHVYPMQSVGIRRIVEDAHRLYPDYHFYLRMHPNLTGIKNEDVSRIRSIQSPNFHLIEPDSVISTYTLIDSADKILTFGSTVGIEAAFWGKPSIMAGHAFYEHLGSVYCPDTHEEVLSLLGKDLPPLDRLGALKYGYHVRTFGIDFKYWRSNGFFDGYFNGVRMPTHVGSLQLLLLPFGKWIHTPIRHVFALDKILRIIDNRAGMISDRITKWTRGG